MKLSLKEWTSRLFISFVLILAMLFTLVILDKVDAAEFMKWSTGMFTVFMTGRLGDKFASKFNGDSKE